MQTRKQLGIGHDAVAMCAATGSKMKQNKHHGLVHKQAMQTPEAVLTPASSSLR